MNKADRERVEWLGTCHPTYDESCDTCFLTSIIDKQELRNGLQDKVTRAGEKVMFGQDNSAGTWGHAGVCNFVNYEQSPRCNCGIADLVTALKELEGDK